jgi:hypothetical protein
MHASPIPKPEKKSLNRERLLFASAGRPLLPFLNRERLQLLGGSSRDGAGGGTWLLMKQLACFVLIKEKEGKAVDAEAHAHSLSVCSCWPASSKQA